MKITDEFLAGLEAKAKALYNGGHSFPRGVEELAAAYPVALLALIAELRQARKDVNRMREDMQIDYEEGRRR